MKAFIRLFFLKFEDFTWGLSCQYNFFLYGPYGLTGVIERMPSRFLVKYLRKYGATIGNDCRIEKGINLHRSAEKRPFSNLIVGNDAYIGHKAKIDLSRKVTIHDHVIIGSRCMLWTHASYYEYPDAQNPVYNEYYGEIEIFEYALLYSGVIVSHGVQIGSHARIGACSLVNRTVEKGRFYGGVPAKLIS
jgi:acetyltransferase-like isoleucine patch superfamily enzyme